MQYMVEKPGTIHLGKQGEHRARELVFLETAAWDAEYGPGEAEIIFRLPGEKTPISVTPGRTDDGAWLWVITATETACPGHGKCELRYTAGGAVVKSTTYQTYVAESLGEGAPIPETSPDNVPQETPAETPLLTDKDGTSYALIVEGGKLMLQTAIGDKKPVVMESDCAVPGGVATLNGKGKLDVTQRTDYSIGHVAGLQDALDAKQGALTFDAEPVKGSKNPVTSGGVYDTLSEKQDMLTGDPGQLIGISNDGTAAATVYPSNCNLLDNWYFADPVNQRGVTNYAKVASGDYSYFIDRWVYFKGIDSITLGSDGMTCSVAGNSYNWVAQPMEDKLFEFLKNRQVTMSALVKGHGKYGMGNLNETSTQMGTAINSDNFELISHTYTWPSADSETPNKYRSLYFGIEAGAVTVLAIKLELGSVQTLARKEGDTWVLNDPPPDKALELAKCQRYYERDFVDRGYGIADTNTGVSIFIPYRVPKRASATFVYDESKFSKALYCLNRNNLAYVPISSIKTVSADRSGCTLFVSAATVVGNIYILKSDCIAVDANL